MAGDEPPIVVEGVEIAEGMKGVNEVGVWASRLG
jgi:hypothetical protein